MGEMASGPELPTSTVMRIAPRPGHQQGTHIAARARPVLHHKGLSNRRPMGSAISRAN